MGMARIPGIVIPDQSHDVVFGAATTLRTFSSLMTNHKHLVVTPAFENSLAKAIGSACRTLRQVPYLDLPHLACPACAASLA